ncbi:hypothetical protein AD998_09930 [bacterium 336/3]|nr:hypothetical protein AD998_09930 [bacterium 336/3]
MQDNKFYQTDFIEAYLKGAVNEADKSTMEKILLADDSLKSEVDFQKDLIHAISDSRKQDLKQMLKNTPIPTHTGMQIPTNWIIGGIATTLVTVVGLVMFMNPSKKPIVTEKQDKVSLKSSQEKTTFEPKNQDVVITPKQEEKTNLQNTTSKTETIPKKEESSSPFIKEIHYLYDGGGVLQLFGDFNYKILDKVDLGNGVKTYIFIQNNFYELVPTGEEPKILKETQIKNPEHIRILSEQLK